MLCLASGVLWFALLGWNPPPDRIIERGPYGLAVPAFAFLTYLAARGWGAALRREAISRRHPAWSPVPSGHCPVCKAAPSEPCDAGLHS